MADVYAQIESDLSAAIPVLDDITLIKGKASKGGEVTLGKVYLYQNKFLEAADIFDEVINSGFMP